jgi:hypothetical protein
MRLLTTLIAGILVILFLQDNGGCAEVTRRAATNTSARSAALSR